MKLSPGAAIRKGFSPERQVDEHLDFFNHNYLAAFPPPMASTYLKLSSISLYLSTAASWVNCLSTRVRALLAICSRSG